MADEILAVKIRGDIEKYLRDIGLEVDKEMAQALLDAALHAEGELKQEIATVFAKGGTGQLSRNPKAILIASKGTVKSSGAFLDSVYADIQDRGGTIKPRSVKNLAIPLSDKAKRTVGLWPRHWQYGSGPGKLHYLKSNRGNKLLVEDTRAKRGFRKIKGARSGASEFHHGFIPHYLLKPSVTIKGKGYIERAKKAAEKGILEIVGQHVNIAIDRTKMTA